MKERTQSEVEEMETSADLRNDDMDRLTIAEVLRDLRAWLVNIVANGPIETRGESDRSGHPHSYAVMVIPDWQVKQKLANVEDAIRLHTEVTATIAECAALFTPDHALDRFDWGKAFLRAQDIRELNELPLKVNSAIAKSGSKTAGSPSPQGE